MSRVKDDVTRVIYEFEKKWLGVLKNIEWMTKDCTEEYEFKEKRCSKRI